MLLRKTAKRTTNIINTEKAVFAVDSSSSTSICINRYGFNICGAVLVDNSASIPAEGGELLGAQSFGCLFGMKESIGCIV
ncbi:hypothetical protein RCL_jg12976.t1 [Rhizophagus clarus]|uniref:Uncharacterized protein n=1 Tax=Rhizophagus clarus TaxID=94130 RepID=A0A8H3R6Q9_9GLOM|nr:hypothetical protein RCL_jg12976.t1 [Rhizophagus clarus]